jgi:hypothetical protein
MYTCIDIYKNDLNVLKTVLLLIIKYVNYLKNGVIDVIFEVS